MADKIIKILNEVESTIKYSILIDFLYVATLAVAICYIGKPVTPGWASFGIGAAGILYTLQFVLSDHKVKLLIEALHKKERKH